MILINGILCDDYQSDNPTLQFACSACKDACNCLVASGDTTTVSGSGSVVDPYRVEVTPGNSSITVDDTDCIDMGGSGTPTNPVTGTLILSPDPDNLLTRSASGCTANGLKVSCTDVMGCLTVGDCLEVVGGELNVKIAPDAGGGNGVECDATGLLVAPSAQLGNTIVYGSDGRLYVPQGSCEAVPITVVTDETGGSDCLSSTGGGCSGDPYVLTLGLAGPDNGLACTDNGLAVVPSSDANNALDFGSDGNLFVSSPAGLLTTTNTATVVHTLTGTGVTGDPYVLSSCSPTVQAVNTGGCITVNVTRVGTACTDPYNVSAALNRDPDICNALVCRPTGLFVEKVPHGQIIVGNEGCTAADVAVPANGALATIPGSQYSATITNPANSCRDMQVMVFIEVADLRMKADAGSTQMDIRARKEEVLGVVPTPITAASAAWANNVERGPGLTANGVDTRRPGGAYMRDIGVLLAPGQSWTVNVDLAANNINVVNGLVEACMILRLVGTYAELTVVA